MSAMSSVFCVVSVLPSPEKERTLTRNDTTYNLTMPLTSATIHDVLEERRQDKNR